jgi:hypothetical protein
LFLIVIDMSVLHTALPHAHADAPLPAKVPVRL